MLHSKVRRIILWLVDALMSFTLKIVSDKLIPMSRANSFAMQMRVSCISCVVPIALHLLPCRSFREGAANVPRVPRAGACEWMVVLQDS